MSDKTTTGKIGWIDMTVDDAPAGRLPEVLAGQLVHQGGGRQAAPHAVGHNVMIAGRSAAVILEVMPRPALLFPAFIRR